MVRVPTPDEEDAKRIHRERESLVQERLRIENAIEALLFTQGIRKRPSRRRRSAIFLSCTPEMDARCHALASAGLWHEHEDALTGLLPRRVASLAGFFLVAVHQSSNLVQRREQFYTVCHRF